MYIKGKHEAKETDLNAQIYDEQMSQVTLKQELIDQAFLLEDIAVDVTNLRDQIEDVQERKQKLVDKVEGMTHEFVAKVTAVSSELEESKEDVLKWKKIRDQFEKLA